MSVERRERQELNLNTDTQFIRRDGVLERSLGALRTLRYKNILWIKSVDFFKFLKSNKINFAKIVFNRFCYCFINYISYLGIFIS